MDNSAEKPTNTIEKRIQKGLIIIAIIIFLIPILIYIFLLEIIYRLDFRRRIMLNNRRIIFVNSNSPIWHDYLNNKWLPKIKEYSYLLNWSERKRWDNKQWEVKMFHHWGGDRNMNPLMIIYKNIFQVKVFRFYEAFLDYNHGKSQKLSVIEEDIERMLNSFIK